MPATNFQSLTFDDVLATTLNEHRPTMTDNFYRSSATLNALTKGGTKEMLDGGARIIEPIMYTNPAGFASYSGTDTISTTTNQKFTGASFEWAQVGGAIVITGTQEILNSGKNARIRLVKAAIEAGEKELRDQVNKMLLKDGSGNGGKDVNGLALIVSPTAQTVGGLAEATYTTWVPQRKYASGGSSGAVSAFGTSLTLTTGGYFAMQDTYSLCTDGEDHPDVGIIAREPFLSYINVLGQNVRYLPVDNEKSIWAGWYGGYFMGMPLVVDRDAALGTYASSNARLFLLNSKYVHLFCHSARNFITEPFQKPVNQDTRVSKLLVACQLTASNRRMNGVAEFTGV